MAALPNLSLRTSAYKRRGLLERFADCVKLLASLATTCPHRNRHFVLARDLQACWDCYRVRRVSRDGFGLWHKGVR